MLKRSKVLRIILRLPLLRETAHLGPGLYIVVGLSSGVAIKMSSTVVCVQLFNSFTIDPAQTRSTLEEKR